MAGRSWLPSNMLLLPSQVGQTCANGSIGEEEIITVLTPTEGRPEGHRPVPKHGSSERTLLRSPTTRDGRKRHKSPRGQ